MLRAISAWPRREQPWTFLIALVCVMGFDPSPELDQLIAERLTIGKADAMAQAIAIVQRLHDHREAYAAAAQFAKCEPTTIGPQDQNGNYLWDLRRLTMYPMDVFRNILDDRSIT